MLYFHSVCRLMSVIPGNEDQSLVLTTLLPRRRSSSPTGSRDAHGREVFLSSCVVNHVSALTVESWTVCRTSWGDDLLLLWLQSKLIRESLPVDGRFLHVVPVKKGFRGFQIRTRQDPKRKQKVTPHRHHVPVAKLVKSLVGSNAPVLIVDLVDLWMNPLRRYGTFTSRVLKLV